jgi:peptidoglycan/LPS O-acetylase OafA/YrhL
MILHSSHNDPRTNNFNLLRLVAALLVLVSHGIELPSGVSQRDFMHFWTGFTLSWFAVNVFFSISGFLIFESWVRRPHLLTFLKARALRIFPALVVMLCISVPLLGMFFGELPLSRYLGEPQTLRYLFSNMTIILVRYELPGVFSGNPLHSVNGSLWTLRYELFCYFLVAVLGAIGLLSTTARRQIVLAIGITGCIGLMLVIGYGYIGQSTKNGPLLELGRLTFCFLLGAMFNDVRRILPLSISGVCALWLSVLTLARTPACAPLACLAAAYTTFYFAFVPQGKRLSAFRGNRDYSYGIYIYAFPIQQALTALAPSASPWAHIFAALLFTLPFAILSWHLVEKPALTLKARVVPARSLA